MIGFIGHCRRAGAASLPADAPNTRFASGAADTDAYGHGKAITSLDSHEWDLGHRIFSSLGPYLFNVQYKSTCISVKIYFIQTQKKLF
jgi:hypothetical protein